MTENAVQPEFPIEIAYTRIGGFGLANLGVDWQATDRASVVLSVNNVFGCDYQLVKAIPNSAAPSFRQPG